MELLCFSAKHYIVSLLFLVPQNMFQSAPGFWAGRYIFNNLLLRINNCFNPLPAFGPGDTAYFFGFHCVGFVSIRSRLLGREIRGLIDEVVQVNKFQSAPGFWAGRYISRVRYMCDLISFNPLPAFGPGDTEHRPD